ncbi:MAG: hypothetical protein PGN16_15070 [Sphingomonas phyllosphaerae]|uniref:hypothetical protein n=1 Tax=Sphingomonas phyllosphaerae TaxID=257003 RepID=UPI002FFAD013
MSGLIKHELAGLAVDRLPRGAVVERVAARDPSVVALEERVAALEALLAAERLAAERAATAAREAIAEARRAGRSEAVADEQRRLQLLTEGIAAAEAAWRERLDATDRLAAQLAALVLSRMFGACDDWAEPVMRALAEQVVKIGAHAIVAVTVSAGDFADDAALAAAVALPAATVTRDAALPAGACRIALRLGRVEIDPARQWAAFEAALRELGGAA